MTKNYTDLTGRVAVVIGGTSGLGRAIALGLAEAGAAVVASGRRQELVDEMAAAITQLGRESLNYSVNVSDRASIDTLRDAVLARFGRVDVLVNAAGRTKRTPTKDLPEQEWEDILDTNLTGILRTCQSFYQPLVSSGRGRIINIASLSSFVGLYEVAAYCASKSGVLSDRNSANLPVVLSTAGLKRSRAHHQHRFSEFVRRSIRGRGVLRV